MTNAQTPQKKKSQKIKVNFKRTSAFTRFRLKYLQWGFFWRVIYVLFRLVLLLGISYVILFPFFAKISASFMSPSDFLDQTVQLIPKYPTLDNYKVVLENEYGTALFNTFLLSVLCGLAQTFVSAVIGYGFAKFKFPGSKLIFGLVLFTMIVPHQTLRASFPSFFVAFDLYGFFEMIGIGPFELTNSFAPLVLLSITGLGFKNGLYIFMMRQFYRGVPDELEESSYIDGYGVFQTFIKIIIPLSIPMMITVFLFSFSWQWTDNFYTKIFFTESKWLMPNVINAVKTMTITGVPSAAQGFYLNAVSNTAGLMVILPLIIMYLFCQRYLIQGIERSGIVG